MSIDWHTRDCAIPWPLDEDETRQRENLILVGSYLDAGPLTTTTRNEWAERIRILAACNKVDSAFCEMVESLLDRWIGLYVNSDKLPRDRWMNRYGLTSTSKT